MTKIKIDKAYIEKDWIIISFLPNENIYSSFKKLPKYLEFIKKLTHKTHKPDFVVSKKEYEYLIYYSFSYFLVNWDNLFWSKQIVWHVWENFKIHTNELLTKEKLGVVLDYKYGNIDAFKNYIEKSFRDVHLSTNKNRIMYYLFDNHLYFLLMNYFLFRSIFRKLLYINQKPKKEFDAIFITNYDRYYGNDRFFGEHLFNDKDFKDLTKKLCGIELNSGKDNKSILYFKPNFADITKYIKNLKDKSENVLFLEDIMYITSGIRIFSHWMLHKNKYKIDLDENLNDDEKFILEMYNDFLLNKLSFILWFYLSIKDFIKNKKIKLIVGDSEKSFMFFLFNLARKFTDEKVNAIAFSHEIVSENYAQVPVSKNFNDIPDYKLVWNENIKKILTKRYNFPEEKVIVFPDPRFLYWKKFPLKKKTILFVSQGVPDFYEELFDIFKNKKEIIDKFLSNGYSFYFKPHPGEIAFGDTAQYIHKLKTISEIKTITELNFLPEYSIGEGSTMQYEFLQAGGKTYFITDKNHFLMDEKEFEKYSKSNIYDALLYILNDKN